MTSKNSKNIYLKLKDYSVSKEDFELIENSEFGFLETKPRPSLDRLPEYYLSEDYISHTDAKRNIFEKLYHLVKLFALKRKLHLINSFNTESKKLLDVGCGTGDFLQVAKSNSWEVVGIEPNNEARKLANKKTDQAVFNSENLFKLKQNSFDVITLWHVLEHVQNLEDQIATFKKLLKPNGVLVIAVPNYKSYDARFYKSFWAAFDVPRHLWHFNKESIRNLFSKFGMQVIKIRPMLFDAFYVSLLSEKYKTGKMNFVKGFYVGLLSNLKSIRTKESSSLIYIIKKN
ncbi:class I SAM-dependent methyltransferase [Gaetbulibacter saemankumensis]|uniref:class I SAM-dependent methyltransferase n=1 Tax=Gaetbulibacter saemankumensis TaxID=311208 RepID=UPI000420E803|nr:class I SAM-dependent methyltransferase [Gaetbulibacter saemankumensis]